MPVETPRGYQLPASRPAAQPRDIVVSRQWVQAVAALERDQCLELGGGDSYAAIVHLVHGCAGGYHIIRPYLDRVPAPRILEVGSGYGLGLCYLLRRGLDAIGIEPQSALGFSSRFQKAVELLRLNGVPSVGSRLIAAVGEGLPFADDSFDIVFSVAVLEHVQSVERCVDEAFRVVKPGGVVIMNVPNYNSFHESHYGIPWLPRVLASKPAAKWYVRTVFRRDDGFVDTLNFTTPSYFQQLRRRLPVNCDLRIYPFLPSPLSAACTAYYYVSEGASLRDRLPMGGLVDGIRTTRPGMLAIRAAGSVLNAAESVGLAPVFLLKGSKQGHIGSHGAPL
jgi:SAM-dependent methyltransferase